jgi:hypothetical protein
MSELWTYPNLESETTPPGFDLTGWDVEARDGHLGKVDEATYEVGRSYIVVDTGFWIFGRKRLIPAGSIQRLDRDNRTIYVSLTKDQVKQAPDYDELRRDDDRVRQRHTDYYAGES